MHVDANLVGVSGLPNLKFWLFPSRLVGPNGFRELAGGVRVSKFIENHAFMRVFCVLLLPLLLLLLLLLFYYYFFFFYYYYYY